MSDLSYLESSPIDEAALSKLSTKIKNLQRIRTEIKQQKSRLKDLEKIEKSIAGEEIPQFMSQFGIDSINLDDGSGVSIKEEISVSLPKTDIHKRKKVLDWISKNGGAGIIKDTTTINDADEAILIALNDLECPFTSKKDIHAQSLKAFFRNILGMQKNSIQKVDLADIPPEANLFIYKDTKIK